MTARPVTAATVAQRLEAWPVRLSWAMRSTTSSGSAASGDERARYPPPPSFAVRSRSAGYAATKSGTKRSRHRALRAGWTGVAHRTRSQRRITIWVGRSIDRIDGQHLSNRPRGMGRNAARSPGHAVRGRAPTRSTHSNVPTRFTVFNYVRPLPVRHRLQHAGSATFRSRRGSTGARARRSIETPLVRQALSGHGIRIRQAHLAAPLGARVPTGEKFGFDPAKAAKVLAGPGGCISRAWCRPTMNAWRSS